MNEHQLLELIKEIDFCIFTTKSGNSLNSRPMSSVIDLENSALHFLTETNSTKIKELKTDNQLHLSYSNGSNNFVVVYAEAHLSQDKNLIKRLWNPGAQAFWPEGPEKSDVTVVRVDIDRADYWTGENKIMSTIKFAHALATGTVADIGEAGSVKL